MNKPKLIIPRAVFDKVLHWCILAKGLEISGLGKCDYDAKTNTFKVVDAQVLKQSIQTAGNTEITAEAIGKFLYDTRDQGSVTWWWHSHHSMGAFWSSTDIDCIDSFGKEGGVVATVFNNKGEHLSACQFKSSTMFGETSIFHDKLDTSVVTYYDTTMFDEWEREYNEAKLVYVPTQTAWSYDQQHGTKRKKPPKKLRKLWDKIPEWRRKQLIFEQPGGKNSPDWIWASYLSDYIEATEYDYKVRDLVEHADLPKEIGTVASYLMDPKELTDIEDDEEIAADERQLIKTWGISESEWMNMEPREREYYKDQSYMAYMGD